MTEKQTLEFVNDWSELEAALEIMRTDNEYDMDLGEWDCNSAHLSGQLEDAIHTVLQYVPRLLTQYASLLETSFALVEGWEQYAQVHKPSGLLVPDHR